MIRILYMSDLHLEMERWRMSIPGWAAFLARHRAVSLHPARGPLLDGYEDIDLVVLAGDIHGGLRGLVYAEQLEKFFDAPVVYVAGNHEFYHHDMARLLPAFGTASAHTGGRVQFLDNAVASFVIRGQRLNVLGCTLWTDYTLHGDAEFGMRIADRSMNDHVCIQIGTMRFMPPDALARHVASRRWLHRTLAALRRDEPDAVNIVVTHHAPGAAYLGPRTGAIAPAYATELLAEFCATPPAAWNHGHTHFRHESVAEGIRVVSAPRGYVTYDGAATLAYKPGVLEI